jgi:preprotein translocase subunit Sec61beta
MAYHDPSDVLQAIVDRHPAVFAVIHEAVLLGWRAAVLDMESLARMPVPLRLRTRRNLANDYAVGYAHQLLEPLAAAGVLRWIDEAETLTLRLEPRYAVRIKKTDPIGRPSNISTRRQRRITYSGQLLLFGIVEDDLLKGDEVWLTVAYVPDALDEELQMVGLVAGDGSLGLHALERADDATLERLAPECWQSIQEARRACG